MNEDTILILILFPTVLALTFSILAFISFLTGSGKGRKGPKGYQGQSGPQGPKGFNGPKGPDIPALGATVINGQVVATGTVYNLETVISPQGRVSYYIPSIKGGKISYLYSNLPDGDKFYLTEAFGYNLTGGNESANLWYMNSIPQRYGSTYNDSWINPESLNTSQVA